MGRKILDKLRSREGASLTFALLAFLVCAAISAVLVAAGMASAGRLSGLAEADQRYYAVTSAAQLFCDAIGEGKSYSLECTEIKKTVTHKVYTINPISGEISSEPVPGGDNENVSTTYKLRMISKSAFDEEEPDEGQLDNDSANPVLASPSVLKEEALYYVFGDKVGEYDKVKDMVQRMFDLKVKPGSASKREKNFQITSDDYPSLTVDVKMEIASDGSMLLTFSNHLTDEQILKKEGVYYIQVGLSANAVTKESSTEREQNVPFWPQFDEETMSYEEKYETIKTTVKTTTITWSVGNVSKVYKQESGSGSGGT